jgi:ApbE superfamily uncharacterized protein (UPF0280 family)
MPCAKAVLRKRPSFGALISYLSIRARAPKQIRRMEYAVKTTNMTTVISTQFISYLIVPNSGQ